MAHALVIRGGTVVDGTGAPARRADVGIRDGRIAGLGDHLDGETELDADGAIVVPGFVDIHTHYDAQVFWDPWLTPSDALGVTTVVAGNCGVSLAPCPEASRELMLETLRYVEDMESETLRRGVDWSWETFPEYLDRIERRGVGLNFGAYVGHQAVRVAVMGDEAYRRAARPDELRAMVATVREALLAGAVGFSSDRSGFHTGAGGRPVPSMAASEEEVDALMRVVGELDRGLCSILVAEDAEWLYALQPELDRPITWLSMLTYPASSPRAKLAKRQLARQRAAVQRGLDVHPQVTCKPITLQISMDGPAVLYAVPAFGETVDLDGPGRRSCYADPDWRSRAREQLESRRWIDPAWHAFRVDESAREEWIGRSVLSIADETGREPLDVVLDLALEEDLSTRFRVTFANGDVPGVTELLRGEGCVLALSDAGAHVDQMCDADLHLDFLAHWVRDRGVMGVEEGIRKTSAEPAALLGLRDRGVLREGAAADVAVLEWERLDPGPRRRVRDLPAGGARLVADAPTGVRHVLVNGVPVRRDGASCRAEGGSLPGRVLR